MSLTGIKISDLPQGVANLDAVVPATNAAGTITEKIKLTDIANLGNRQFDIGNSGASVTLSLVSGNVQTVTLNAQCVFTMPAPVRAGNISLVVTQSGSFTASFPGVLWPGGITASVTSEAGSIDVITFFSDGINWYGSAVPNLS